MHVPAATVSTSAFIRSFYELSALIFRIFVLAFTLNVPLLLLLLHFSIHFPHQGVSGGLRWLGWIGVATPGQLPSVFQPVGLCPAHKDWEAHNSTKQGPNQQLVAHAMKWLANPFGHLDPWTLFSEHILSGVNKVVALMMGWMLIIEVGRRLGEAHGMTSVKDTMLGSEVIRLFYIGVSVLRLLTDTRKCMNMPSLRMFVDVYHHLCHVERL